MLATITVRNDGAVTVSPSVSDHDNSVTYEDESQIVTLAQDLGCPHVTYTQCMEWLIERDGEVFDLGERVL